MGDHDNSPMLYCSGYSPIQIPFASGGWANSRMFGHDSAAAFLSTYKKTTRKQRVYDSSPLLLFGRGVTVPSNFS